MDILDQLIHLFQVTGISNYIQNLNYQEREIFWYNLENIINDRVAEIQFEISDIREHVDNLVNSMTSMEEKLKKGLDNVQSKKTL